MERRGTATESVFGQVCNIVDGERKCERKATGAVKAGEGDIFEFYEAKRKIEIFERAASIKWVGAREKGGYNRREARRDRVGTVWR